jgi:hypothetical protein
MKGQRASLRNQRGAAPLKAIIAIAVLGVLIYWGIQIVPIYYDHYNLEDDIKQAVLIESSRLSTEESPKKIKDMVINGLKQIKAQFRETDVKVEIVGGNKIVVDVNYWRQHNVPGFPKQFHIHHESTPI